MNYPDLLRGDRGLEHPRQQIEISDASSGLVADILRNPCGREGLTVELDPSASTRSVPDPGSVP